MQLSAISLAITRIGRVGGFDPYSLFSSGEQGVFYDPSDLSTLFQDSSGTTPVTADGQPVGLIRDKSGNNNHASQATAAKRPLYKTDGTLHWLNFDGVDDALATAAIDFTSTDKMSVFSGVERGQNLAYRLVYEFNGNPNSVNKSFNFGVPINGSDAFVNCRGTQSSGNIFVATNATNVFSLYYDLAGINHDTTTKCRVNGVAVAGYPNGNATAGGGTFASGALAIGSRVTNTEFFNGRIYSLIALGRLATTQEITDTEAWVAAKTGVVLP